MTYGSKDVRFFLFCNLQVIDHLQVEPKARRHSEEFRESEGGAWRKAAFAGDDLINR